MDVIGAGFGRTGTLSLKTALEQLGFGPCMHMVSVLEDSERVALFQRAAENDAGSLERALDGCRSTVDWPGTFFWHDLVAKYPDAKVILTVRDPQKWYDSAYRTIFQAANARRDATEVPPGVGAVMDMVHAVVWDGTFGGRFDDRDHAVRTFEEHNAEVRRTVPAERLLEFQVSQGWEPLCGFLGRPVPDLPFPRLNDSAEFEQRVAGFHAQAQR